jgi:hypothetical protein
LIVEKIIEGQIAAEYFAAAIFQSQPEPDVALASGQACEGKRLKSGAIYHRQLLFRRHIRRRQPVFEMAIEMIEAVDVIDQ